MKILYLHQYFVTPAQPSGTRSYWIAKALVKNGFKVTIITSDSNRSSIKVTKETVDGIDVVYIPNSYDNSMGLLKRLWSFISFMFKSTYYALKERNIDLVFATSTPLTIGIPALVKKWMHGTPYVFEVRDLWPEVPIQMGALKNKWIIKMAVFLEKTIYANSKHVVALSPGMEEGVLRFEFMKDKTSMVPNMSKPDIFYPREKCLKISKRFNIDPDKFNVVHFGAMGIANGLDYIIKAAIISRDEFPEIIFHFFGGGKTEQTLKDLCNSRKLNNVLFHGPLPMDILSDCINSCDVSLVTFLNIPILRTNSPNKLFDSLSAGLPTIVNSSGWTKDMVEENECGFYVDPEDPKDLVNKLVLLKKDEVLRQNFSKNSRELALKAYDKDVLCEQVSNILNYEFKLL